MLKREWGAESTGKLPHLFIPSKTAPYVPEFAMEDLPLGRIAALVPEFAVKDLPLGRTLMIYIYDSGLALADSPVSIFEVLGHVNIIGARNKFFSDYDGQ